MPTKPATGTAAPSRMAESPLLRLAASREADGQPFLQPHQLLAADRLARLVERARLGPRLTMSYDPARVSSGRGSGNSAAEMSDSAAAARRRLGLVAAAMPTDCWGVVIDVCGFGKGLQLVETERQWPRRSAKLVLRIGLEHLANIWGLSAGASGFEHGHQRHWLGERLPLIAEKPEAPA
ncbi:MAG: replication protein [Devosia sp.]|jgi:hypothetical protein|nr:replication protein [Devosia sp.]